MNKRCRLLLTAKCPNNCPLCCNKQYNLENDIPVISRWDYDEFILTGGEPLKFPTLVKEAICDIKGITNFMGSYPKFYLYTSICDVYTWDYILPYLDGITYTIHNNAKDLIRLIEVLRNFSNGYDSVFGGLSNITSKSIRLNLFPESKDLVDTELALTSHSWDNVSDYFHIKPIEWQDNCPIPEGEDFRRINNLW